MGARRPLAQLGSDHDVLTLQTGHRGEERARAHLLAGDEDPRAGRLRVDLQAEAVEGPDALAGGGIDAVRSRGDGTSATLATICTCSRVRSRQRNASARWTPI